MFWNIYHGYFWYLCQSSKRFPPTKFNEIRLWRAMMGKEADFFFPFWDSASAFRGELWNFRGGVATQQLCNPSPIFCNKKSSKLLQVRIPKAFAHLGTLTQKLSTPFLVDWKCPTTWLEPPAIIYMGMARSKNPLDRPAVIRTSGTRGLRKGTWSRGFQGTSWKIMFSWYDIICLHESVAWPEVTWKGGEIYSS